MKAHVLLVLLFVSVWCRADQPRHYTIPVIVHNLVGPDSNAYVSDTSIRRQIEILNEAYYPARIHFRLERIERQISECYSRPPVNLLGLPITDRMLDEFLALPENNPDVNLNIFIIDYGIRFEGFSSMPWNLKEEPLRDAVMLNFDTLPSDKRGAWYRGDTAVHEVGHYLGLYHTFQGGCEPPGDMVDDTPAEAKPSYTWKERDTCPEMPGKDPVENYMDYARDDPRKSFTKGQIKRMHAMIEKHRPSMY